MLSDMPLTTLIKRINEQKLKENGLGLLIRTKTGSLQHMAFTPLSVVGQQTKLTTHVKSVSMY